MRIGIVRLYCGDSGKKGFYNLQEVGFAREMKKYGYKCYIFFPDKKIKIVKEEYVEENILLISCPARAIGIHSYYDWNILLNYSLDIVQIESDNQIFAPNIIHFCKRNKLKFYNYIGIIESDTTNIFKKIIFKILFFRNIKVYRKSKCFVKNKKVFMQLSNLMVKDVDIMPVGLDYSRIPSNVFSSRDIRKQLHLPLGRKIILFVGRIEEYKNPMGLKMIISRNDYDFYYVIIGTGSLDHKFEIMLKENLHPNQYIWHKKVPNDQIYKFYAASDYYINLNPNEIFGMSILEAMYQGCTVIAVHAPGPDMIIEHGVSGYLAKDIKEVHNILNSYQPLDKNVVAEYITTNFSWHNAVQIINKWLEKQDNSF